MAIRAVTFDVGGTLIEPWPSVGHIYATVAAEHGLRGLDPAELNRRFASAWRAHPKFQHTRAAWSDLVTLTFSGLIHRPPSETFFCDLYDRFRDPAAWHIYDDVLPALERLARRGLRLGIISNWDDRLRPLLQRLDLAKWFSAIIVSCEAGRPKPHPAIFQDAAAQLGFAPAMILHVGDNLEQDVRGARSTGLQAVLLDRGQKQPSTGVVHSLGELP